jgi:hypothetical protein
MEQVGEHRFAAARIRVWEALNDPDVLKRCIPGCESLTLGEGGVFHGVVAVKLGPLSASFSGDVALKDVDPPNGYTLEVAAKGGAAGFARGVAKVALHDDGDRTVLTYAAEGRVGGKLAQIGQRLVDAAARKTADDFFTVLAQVVEAREGDMASGPFLRVRRPVVWAVVALAMLMLLVVWRLTAR